MSLEEIYFVETVPVAYIVEEPVYPVYAPVVVLQEAYDTLDLMIAMHQPRPVVVPVAVNYPTDPRTHFLESYSYLDNTVELEDGSFWRVSAFDMYKLSKWASNDPLSITPDPLDFRGYRIVNRTTRESIDVKLQLGPVAFGPNTHWIIGVDRWLSRVYLENGTYWDVRGLDRDLLAEWDINDTIILGDGQYEWMGNHDSILINVNLNHYVYADRRA